MRHGTEVSFIFTVKIILVSLLSQTGVLALQAKYISRSAGLDGEYS